MKLNSRVYDVESLEYVVLNQHFLVWKCTCQLEKKYGRHDNKTMLFNNTRIMHYYRTSSCQICIDATCLLQYSLNN